MEKTELNSILKVLNNHLSAKNIKVYSSSGKLTYATSWCAPTKYQALLGALNEFFLNKEFSYFCSLFYKSSYNEFFNNSTSKKLEAFEKFLGSYGIIFSENQHCWASKEVDPVTKLEQITNRINNLLIGEKTEQLNKNEDFSKLLLDCLISSLNIKTKVLSSKEIFGDFITRLSRHCCTVHNNKLTVPKSYALQTNILYKNQVIAIKHDLIKLLIQQLLYEKEGKVNKTFSATSFIKTELDLSFSVYQKIEEKPEEKTINQLIKELKELTK